MGWVNTPKLAIRKPQHRLRSRDRLGLLGTPCVQARQKIRMCTDCDQGAVSGFFPTAADVLFFL